MSEAPPGWSKRRLMDLVWIPSGQVDPRVEPYRSQVLIAPDHIASASGRILNRETAASQGAISGKYQIFAGDVLYSKIRPALRKAALADFSGICSADIYPLRPSSEIDSDYLLNVILSERFSKFAESVSGRSGIPKINRTELEEFWLPLPPMTEQRRIAEILDAADEAIRSTERLIAKLEQAKQGLLHDLLVRQSWPTFPIQEIAVKVTDGDHHTPIKSTGGIPLIGAGNVQDGYLNLSDQEFVDEAEYARMITRCHPEPGDILISCSGSIGRVAQVPDGLRLALVRSVALVKPDTGKCLSGFLELALQSPFVQRQIKNTQKQLAQANLFQSAISDLQIPLPEISKQRAIVEYVSSYRAAITTDAQELSKLRLLKRGLMNDLLTGRVRVEAAA